MQNFPHPKVALRDRSLFTVGGGGGVGFGGLLEFVCVTICLCHDFSSLKAL